MLAARANGLAVIDGVYNDIQNADGFGRPANRRRAFGFDGKTLIHPTQVEPCNAMFAPSAAEVEAARKMIAAFELPENKGKGAIKLDGRMVELLHAEIARGTVAMADAIAALNVHLKNCHPGRRVAAIRTHRSRMRDHCISSICWQANPMERSMSASRTTCSASCRAQRRPRGGFTKKYEVKSFVWFERHGDIHFAIEKEKRLKRWRRDWKIRLIEEDNPHWLDLYPALLNDGSRTGPLVRPG